jgi:uncharacterized spore protein YtfJ
MWVRRWEVDMVATIDEARETARAAAAEPIDRMLDKLGERIGMRASVRAVFGEPVERGEVTIIPVARVRWGYGGGSGTGPVRSDATDGQTMSGGSGAGGGVMADPMGYVEVRHDGAAYVPLSSPWLNPFVILASGISIAIVIRVLARLIRG